MVSARFTAAATSIALVLCLMPAAPARAWSNGVNGCDSFGTHDWILRKAIGAAGRDASWVNTRVALRATDDPDCRDGIDHASGTWWHVYDRWGATYGDAPEAARVWFRRMERRLSAGRERAASKALGYLAHIVGDVAQPMHTDSTDREDRVHSSYEGAVDSRIGTFGFTHNGHDDVRPYARTVRLATAAHEYYFELVRTYDRSGYTARVNEITKQQLNRAANAMADLLTTLGRSA